MFLSRVVKWKQHAVDGLMPLTIIELLTSESPAK